MLDNETSVFPPSNPPLPASIAASDGRPRANSGAAVKSPTSPLAASLSAKDLDHIQSDGKPLSDQLHDSLPSRPPVPSIPSTYSSHSPESSRDMIVDTKLHIAPQVPEPHIPLRRKLTRTLKLGRKARISVAAAEREREQANQASIAEIALWLRPQTATRSSQGSNTSKTEEDSPQSTNETPTTNDPLPTNGPARLRPGSGLDGPVEPPLASPFLRPVTSTSDYVTNGPSYRNTSANSPLPDGAASPAVSEYPASKKPPPFWKDSGVESARYSVRSAWTNGSSAPDLSSNGRTSGVTDRSSTSDTALHNSDWSKEQDDELTVEDCISMYAQGFTDDPMDEIPPVPPIPQSPATTLMSDSGRDVPSQKQSTPSITSTSLEPIRPQDRLPSNRTLSQITVSERPRTASLGIQRSPVPQRNPPRDLYGFKKETQHVTLEQYTAWEAGYQRFMERRRRKWIHLMNEAGLPSDNPQYFPSKSDKVKRYIRKGIPPEWRGAAWFFYADGSSFITKNPGLYNTLVTQAAEGHISESDREHIERDLHRTLPENKHFKPDLPSSAADGGDASPVDPVNEPLETDMIRSLRRILQAFAVHHPRVGYCQSLNFLAGHLLLFMRAAYPSENYEERAFVLLCILTEKHLPGTHGVVLEGANVDIGVLMMFIQESMPGLWAKLDDKTESGGTDSPAISRKGTAGLPTVSLATTAWFMSCFVSTLPIETTCRVWDCLWYEGSKTIFRVALAIFKLGEREIRKSKDPMEMFQVVQNLPRCLLDANTLMDIATKKRKVPGGDSVNSRIGPSVGGFGGLSAKTVENRREERRMLTRRERERTTMLDGMVPPPIPEEAPMPTRTLSRSSSRSRLKRFRSVKKLA